MAQWLAHCIMTLVFYGTLHNDTGFQWQGKAPAQILISLVLAEYTAAALLCLQEA